MPILLNDSGTWRTAGAQKGLLRLWSRQPLARDPYGIGAYPIWVRGRTVWRRDGSVWTPYSGGPGAEMGNPSMTVTQEQEGWGEGEIVNPSAPRRYYTHVTVPWGSAACIALWRRDGSAQPGLTGWIYDGCYDNPGDGTPFKVSVSPSANTTFAAETSLWFVLTAFAEPSNGAAFPASAQGFTHFVPAAIGDSDQNAYV